MTKVLAVVGPTAVGKTGLAIQIANKFNGEIISGDSMQIYRGLDIGTAKATSEEQAAAKHWLIDIADVHDRYSAADFTTQAADKISDITNRGKLPIIAGGTGFYLQALLDGMQLGGDAYTDGAVREKWLNVARREGNQMVWNRLNSLDPVAATKIPVKNVRRTVRALEVIETTGHLFSDQQDEAGAYDSLIIGLNTDRARLYSRINERVEMMFRNGLLQEAKWLYDQGGVALPAGKGIGYREFQDYFEGHGELNDVVEKIKLDSRHYAKRQLTWFRNKTAATWFDLVQQPETVTEIEALVSHWLD
ncbi:tRNA (adenosine(37)-N6)-dimethylallyltransferase MiaA [Levilactobacillus bambusae]|uniref:tRNA dimethylallyltransferase n=1 Tax=Levilactobacillus bambusae TaxID=2024736 RepID=A0A2V1N5A9_9LACO|nr:tRNA (adenosine(37)-N6)-dimethylallyltransferase MiaA [Levilactobacillus bambusae]PWG00995.1 tRNA (adenosine(37)-N6)-dimethylallyltransferase MiaA [Levilactobacillus bambusae]